ncbi:peptidoglycan DD-metalloendopeptidase family protein [Streptomyces sp. ID38640]|uniref:M23 family metallopeptidase n=1 Tax=Streptomyces sp. ID38640 TaxID=1265399 RepID=UPI00140F2B34|nr:M23 family metallopeptidase [Streptomyces sp. ID38640]QIK07031.1 peptidoglycan DD-metalloendopeptidase family protein [Streptomyces sp. ID38640]
MNDRHPSGAQPPTGSASDASYAHYPAYDSYGQQASTGNAEYGDGDPLFGSLPGSYETGMYDTGTYGMYDTGTHGTADAYGMSAYGTGTYSTEAYDTGTYPAGDGYATGAYDTGTYATTQWDTGGWDTGAYAVADPHAATPGYDPYAHTTYDAPAHDATAYTSSGYETAGYEATAYGHGGFDGGFDTGSYPTGAYDTGSYATGAYETADAFDAFGRQATAVEETASFEATAIWSTTDQDLIAGIPAQAGPPPTDTIQWDSATWDEAGHFDTAGPDAGRPGSDPYDTGRAGADDGSPRDAEDYSEAAAVADAMTQAMPITPAAPAPAGRRVTGPDAGKAVRGRGRRRTAKRSALLTVAVPSVAALGVCAVATAAVADFGGDDKADATAQAAPDAAAVKPSAANNKLDTQLAGLSASADDFRDRASRTQERIDLKERQELERQRKAKEAARKEAMRPKFMLPVKEHGLSAQFGQAGVNWMSLHTGIDFPVSYGTPVMSATDGTVRTQWNSAYGNMAIVTAADGTETWYCHLSSTKIRSGSVKAGDQIAYSGNSGNSTGPHLHFEVRPGGGAAVDPLPWLQDHGLDPN